MYLMIFFTMHLVLQCLAIHFPSTHLSKKFHVSYRSLFLTRSANPCVAKITMIAYIMRI